MKVGYLAPEFLGKTHAFFWRKTAAIEKSGRRISSFSRPAGLSRGQQGGPARIYVIIRYGTPIEQIW